MMQGIHAVYDLSEIRASREGRRVSKTHSAPPVTPPAQRALGTASAGGDAAPLRGEALDTLAEMLNEHFAEEIRVRDHDGDGRLSRHEYGGEANEFKALDRDHDGLVGTRDLVQEALARNEGLRELVQGRWSPVYNGLLKLEHPSVEQLDVAACGICREHELDVEAFLTENPDLPALHTRLSRLADRLGRFRRYHPVDLSV